MSAGEIVIAIATGVVAGAYAGLLGVGGGIVMVPAMVILLDQPQRVAEGTSLLAIVGTSFVAARAHHRGKLILPRLAGLLASGGVVGALIGGLIAVSLIDDEDLLRSIFGVFLIVMAAWIVLRRPAARDESS
ncbi:MAG TPA: sulfite exporter TauE/SafE family protein [Actinomycetota bacterium]|nr:sulfite exporter TauE/SafE family protein [Actinomycetota bacterium]